MCYRILSPFSVERHMILDLFLVIAGYTISSKELSLFFQYFNQCQSHGVRNFEMTWFCYQDNYDLLHNLFQTKLKLLKGVEYISVCDI